MQAQTKTAEERQLLLQSLFPGGIPTLWCPALTHYAPDGAIDRQRIGAHLRHLSSHVSGFLIPGSTGDGWELTDEESREVIQIGLEQAQRLQLHLLIGVLKPDARQTFETMMQFVSLIKSFTRESHPLRALLKARVCGFTVCAPRGKHVSQQEMERGLTPILETGLPIALYQLPQVTENELGVELLEDFRQRFPHLLFFKDTSGADRLISSVKDWGGIFTVRGAEGNYLDWFKSAGGRYDGFLLSSANVLAKQLAEMLSEGTAGRIEHARNISKRVTAIITETFTLVKGMSDGNAFANANKALDHFFAHGADAEKIPAPRLHAGITIPEEIIRKTGDVLRRHACMPTHGYSTGSVH
jgi:4-hydroxy-tetrahydrodipicolinate synthase